MNTKYEKFGPVEYRPGKSHDPAIRKLSLPDADELAYVWKPAGVSDDEAEFGLGYPVLGPEGTVVNFLKMHLSGALFDKNNYIEESFLPGLPINGCRVNFGKPTATILVTVDCHSASILWKATQLGTVAVLFWENLGPVCLDIRSKHPDKAILIFIDGDSTDEHSIPLAVAEKAANNIGVRVCGSGTASIRQLYSSEGKEVILEMVQSNTPSAGAWGNGDVEKYFRQLRMPQMPLHWPKAVDGLSLIKSITDITGRHVFMTDEQHLMCALWAMHTYGLQHAKFTPLLSIMSTELSTGKARLLEVLRRICMRAHRTLQITPENMLALNGDVKTTMLFDDGDSMIEDKRFLKIFEMSHDRFTGGITSKSKNKIGSSKFFLAKAIKTHLRLPDTLIFKSIPILMRAKPVEVHLEEPPFDIDGEINEFAVMRSQIARWWQDHGTAVWSHPMDIDLGRDRSNETFSPLFAIAKEIGADVLAEAVDAARSILSEAMPKSDGEELLENIRECLASVPNDRIFSKELATMLCSNPDWKWSTNNRGKPLDQTALASKLSTFGIETHDMRIASENRRGYYVYDFQEAFVTHLGN